jgi:hypothetical protein
VEQFPLFKLPQRHEKGEGKAKLIPFGDLKVPRLAVAPPKWGYFILPSPFPSILIDGYRDVQSVIYHFVGEVLRHYFLIAEHLAPIFSKKRES